MKKHLQKGYLLVSILISTFLIVAIGVSTSQFVVSNYKISHDELYRMNAQFALDAGADYSVQQLNQDQDWTGTSGEVTMLDNTTTKLTYESTITDVDASNKTATIIGRTYAPASSSTPKAERKIELALRGIGGGISGSFSVVGGIGGLVMSNNSKIVGGEVYINGKIALSNSAQIGLTTQSVDVKVAHQSCPLPPDATYPRVCNSGESGEPISITHTAKIYGEVRATNQTNGSGMSNTGLVAGSTVAPAALPSHDRAALVGAISSNQTGATAGCNNGAKTWPANLKITGDVTISGSCKVTVAGDVWITGNLTMSNSSDLIVSNSLTAPPVIMIDGSGGFTGNNSSELVSNSASTPIGFRVITYWSRASCSPGCSDVTGSDLYNSRDDNTIILNNSSSGPNTEFYARWTAISITNSGNLGALVGQTVKLSNSSTITFGATVTGFTATEPAAWVVASYKKIF